MRAQLASAASQRSKNAAMAAKRSSFLRPGEQGAAAKAEGAEQRNRHKQSNIQSLRPSTHKARLSKQYATAALRLQRMVIQVKLCTGVYVRALRRNHQQLTSVLLRATNLFEARQLPHERRAAALQLATPCCGSCSPCYSHAPNTAPLLWPEREEQHHWPRPHFRKGKRRMKAEPSQRATSAGRRVSLGRAERSTDQVLLTSVNAI